MFTLVQTNASRSSNEIERGGGSLQVNYTQQANLAFLWVKIDNG